MEKRIITISREFGSGGRFIGEEVANKLGISYYDKDIIGQIAEQSGFSPEYIRENAELFPKKGIFAYAFSGRDITGKSVEDMVYEVTEKRDPENCGKRKLRGHRKKYGFYLKRPGGCAECFYTRGYAGKGAAYL